MAQPQLDVRSLSNELEQLYQRIVSCQGQIIFLQDNLTKNNIAFQNLASQYELVDRLIKLLPENSN